MFTGESTQAQKEITQNYQEAQKEITQNLQFPYETLLVLCQTLLPDLCVECYRPQYLGHSWIVWASS